MNQKSVNLGRNHVSLSLLGALGVGTAVLTCAPAARADYAVVTTTADNDVDDGDCSLREAVRAVGLQTSAIDDCVLQPGPNEVRAAAGVYLLAEPIVVNGAANVIVVGNGYDSTLIVGGGTTLNAFVVEASLNLRAVTIRDFLDSALWVEEGGALSVEFAKITNNGSPHGNPSVVGGCIHSLGFLNMLDSECSGSGGFRASAIYSGPDAIMGIYRSTITDNLGETGTVYNDGGLADIANTTIGNNRLTVRGSAVIGTDDSVTKIQGSTIAHNITLSLCEGTCGALHTGSNAIIELESTIIAHNIGGTDLVWPATCSGPGIVSLGYNVMGIDSAPQYVCGDPSTHQPTDIVDDPMLLSGPEAVPNGGVGRTYVPDPASPVLGRIPATSGLCHSDQRNIGRGSEFYCDMGAVERGDALLVVDADAPTAGDAVVLDTLTRLGFDVVQVDDQAAGTGSSVNKAVVVISNSVVSDNVGDLFRDVPRGVLVMEPFLYDDMGMALPENLGFTAPGTDMLVIPQTAIGYNFGMAGVFQVTNSPQPFGYASVATTHADFDASFGIQQYIFSFSEGALLTDNTPAVARRVGFFAGDGASADLTPEGLRLLEEAILRAAFSNQPVGAPIGAFESSALWITQSGTLGEDNSNFTEGAGSMSINSSGYTRIDSVEFSTSNLVDPGPELHLDVYVSPSGQPNSHYLGAVQLYVDVPSAGIYNQYIGQVDLTPLGSGWLTLAYALPSNVQTAFNESHDDVRYGIAVNTEPGAPPVLLDNLRFAD